MARRFGARKRAACLTRPGSYALRRVARARGVGGLRREDYRKTGTKLIAADQAQWGEDGLLDQALPTVNQIDGQYGFTNALQIAGLTNPATADDAPASTSASTPPGRRGRGDAPPVQRRGLPLASAMALYGALNDKWPSPTTLIAFAASDTACGSPTTSPKRRSPAHPLANSHRSRLRHPDPGVDTQPPNPRGPAPSGRQNAGARQRQLAADCKDLFAAKHELHIIALRVWLASLGARERRSRAAYLTWRRGRTWPSPSRFDHGHGGFAALRQAAENANRAEKTRTGTPTPPDLLDRAEQLKRQINPRQPACPSTPAG